jgi:toxin CcdB
MPRFEVFAGLGEGEGLVVDVQASLLSDLATRVVIPLLPVDSVRVIRDLNPVVQLNGRTCVVLTQEIAAVPRTILKRKIGDLGAYREDIVRALDILLTGF